MTAPAGRRLAVIAGTSLVSHGVDLPRLNVQFILGMPSTLAYYVQATSRAGRSAVGLIFTALNRYHLRDRSVFHFFEPTHQTSITLSNRSRSTGSASMDRGKPPAACSPPS